MEEEKEIQAFFVVVVLFETGFLCDPGCPEIQVIFVVIVQMQKLAVQCGHSHGVWKVLSEGGQSTAFVSGDRDRKSV